MDCDRYQQEAHNCNYQNKLDEGPSSTFTTLRLP